MSGNIIIPANIIEVRQGDTFIISFQVKKDCSAYDLDGSIITIKANDKATNLTVLEKTAVGVDMVNGKMALVIDPQDTENIAVGDYECIIKITFQNGDVHTIFPEDVRKIGIFRVTPKV